MKVPLIGISTKTFSYMKWYKEAVASGFDVVEINRRVSWLPFNSRYLQETIRNELSGRELSLHSAFKLFEDANGKFTDVNYNSVKAEVLACEILGAKELILHLTNELLTGSQVAQYGELLAYAKKHHVDIIFESNAAMNGPTTLDVLSRFPDLKYNLDFGHLNKGLHDGTLGVELDEFLEKVKDRVVYIHAHNNHGVNDEHKALSDGNLDWKHVLDSINLSNVRKIIIEMKGMDNIKKSKEDLDAYFKAK